MKRTLIAIGGGEIKNKTTLKIDEYVSIKLKNHANPNRANCLFLGTASHDSMPYFNSFRKTYTSVFDIKAEVALMVYGEMNKEHILEKFEKANGFYIGGGDTLFMLETLKNKGVLDSLISGYKKGKIVAGLSAGAICFFETMYTDYLIMQGKSSDYAIKKGLGVIKGAFCPHYDERREDFIKAVKENNIPFAYGVENNSALVFEDEKLVKSLSSGGKTYLIKNQNGIITEEEI